MVKALEKEKKRYYVHVIHEMTMQKQTWPSTKCARLSGWLSVRLPSVRLSNKTLNQEIDISKETNLTNGLLAHNTHTILTHTLTPSDICKCETDKIDYNNKCRRSSVSLDYKKSKIKTKYDTFSVHSGSSGKEMGSKVG